MIGKGRRLVPAPPASAGPDSDLREGLSWIAGLRIKPKGRESGFRAQTLFSSGTADDPLAVVLVIDPDDSLTFRIGECAVTIPAKQARPFVDRWAMFGCYASFASGKLKLQLELDNAVKAETICGYRGPLRFSGLIIGGGSAKFELVGVWGFPNVVRETDRAQMLGYLRDKFPDDDA